jgi:hypothetical protein
MRYRLRTLLILMAVGPPVLAWSYAEIKRQMATELDHTWDEPEIIDLFLSMAPPGDSDDGIMTFSKPKQKAE